MSITITLSKDAAGGGFPKTETFTFGDAAVDRLIEWAKVAYPSPADPVTGIVPPTTPNQAMRRWARGVVQGTRDNIRRYEDEVAKAAVAPSAPIDIGAA